MKDEKDVGLEDVNVVDFVNDTKGEDNTQKTVEKTVEKSMENITSFPWKDVSHVVIGPNGVSLVPTGYSDKFSMPTKDNKSHPTPGQAPTVLEYDIQEIVGSMNEAETLRGENKLLTEELANIRAELEKTKAQLSDVPATEKEPVAEVTETPEETEVTDTDKPPVDPPAIEEQTVVNEKTKEEIILEEKKDAVIAGEPKVEAEHSEDNLGDAMRLMQVAKKRNLL